MRSLVAAGEGAPSSVVAAVAALDLVGGPIVAVEAAGIVADIGLVVGAAAGTGYQNIAIANIAGVADSPAAVAAGNLAGVAIALPDIDSEAP